LLSGNTPKYVSDEFDASPPALISKLIQFIPSKTPAPLFSS
jgi:hypothetical protein